MNRLCYRNQSSLDFSIIRRGAIFASLLLPGSRRVDISTLHTTGWFALCRTRLSQGDPIEVCQLHEAIDWFRHLSPVSGNTFGEGVQTSEAQPASLRIFCGDFNVEKGTATFKRSSLLLGQSNLFDTNAEMSATFGGIEGNGCWQFEKPQVLDHIFADHLPVV